MARASICEIYLLTLPLVIAGCGPNGEAVTDRSIVSPGSQVELPEPSDNIGDLWYSALDGWPSRAPKIGNGVVMFAPENPDWKALGFRPNLSVKIRDNPGMSLGELKAILEETLDKNVQELNTSLFLEAQAVLDSKGHTLTIEDIKFDLVKSSLADGYPCIESESFGAFNLDGRIIRTKTLAVALLDSANMYTATIIIPMSHEEELTSEWDKFKKTLRHRNQLNGG